MSGDGVVSWELSLLNGPYCNPDFVDLWALVMGVRFGCSGVALLAVTVFNDLTLFALATTLASNEEKYPVEVAVVTIG